MTPPLKTSSVLACALLVCLLLGAGGCGKAKEEVAAPSAAPPKPQQAATEMQQAFVNARPEVQRPAQEVSQAIQSANYEQAVKSLEQIRAHQSQNLTPEQRMAVYNSSRTLEARLIAAMEAGDPKAKQAYEMLKKSRRN